MSGQVGGLVGNKVPFAFSAMVNLSGVIPVRKLRIFGFSNVKEALLEIAWGKMRQKPTDF